MILNTMFNKACIRNVTIFMICIRNVRCTNRIVYETSGTPCDIVSEIMFMYCYFLVHEYVLSYP